MFQPSHLVRVVPFPFGLVPGLALFVAHGAAQATASTTTSADNPQAGVAINHLNTRSWLSHYDMARRLGSGSGISGQTSPLAPAAEHFPQQNVPTSPPEQRSRMTTRLQM